MQLYTLGGSKLQSFHCCLGVDEPVHLGGVHPTGGDGEQVVNQPPGRDGHLVFEVVEVLALLQALFTNGVYLKA